LTTTLQGFSVKNPHLKSPVNIARQKAAFPPNFIHSLDATHMLMTALECCTPHTKAFDKSTAANEHENLQQAAEKDSNQISSSNQQMSDDTFSSTGNPTDSDDPLTFAAVHDSYWTHACDVERMRTILKQQFIDLHSQPILERLREELIERYGERKVLKIYTIEEWHQKRADRLKQQKLQQQQQQQQLQRQQDKQRHSEASVAVEVVEEISGEELEAEKRAIIKTQEKEEEKSKTLGIIVDSGEDDDDEININTTAISDDPIAAGREQSGEQSGADSVPYSIDEVKIRRNQKYVRVWETIEIAPLPPRGDFDIRKVSESEYFFS
jgi:DNA-directed RNA polymerase